MKAWFDRLCFWLFVILVVLPVGGALYVYYCVCPEKRAALLEERREHETPCEDAYD